MMKIKRINSFCGWDGESYFCLRCGKAGFKSVEAVRGHLRVCGKKQSVLGEFDELAKIVEEGVEKFEPASQPASQPIDNIDEYIEGIKKDGLKRVLRYFSVVQMKVDEQEKRIARVEREIGAVARAVVRIQKDMMSLKQAVLNERKHLAAIENEKKKSAWLKKFFAALLVVGVAYLVLSGKGTKMIEKAGMMMVPKIFEDVF